MSRCGTAADHCCWLGGAGACAFVQAAPDGPFLWRCGLRAELGNWPAVHSDPRYLARVKPALEACGVSVDCGDWPPLGTPCRTCGEGVSDG